MSGAKQPHIPVEEFQKIQKDIRLVENGKIEIFVVNGEYDGYDILSRRRRKNRKK